MKLGVLPWRVRPRPGVKAWATRLEREVSNAALRGAELLFTAEYAPLELAMQPSPNLAGELRTACDFAQEAIEAARVIAQRHKIWLMPGTLPFRIGDKIHNRAALIAPDGRVAWQDKHVMTRFEAELWGINPGTTPSVFETQWGRIGIAICYDLEFPSLVRAQVQAGAWLILAPSCTDTLAGFNRVRIAARARAMENQCFVALAPTVGAAPAMATLDENCGCAGVYGPVDRGFAPDGVVAEGEMDAHEWLIVDLDPTCLAAVREDGAVRNHRDHPLIPPISPLAAFA